MKIIVLIVYWGLVAALIALLVKIDPGIQTKTQYDILRLIIPAVAIFGLFGIEKLLQLHLRSMAAGIIRRIIAIPLLVLGLNWFCIFTLTDYRINRRPQIIPMAIGFLIVGFILLHLRIHRSLSNGQPSS